MDITGISDVRFLDYRDSGMEGWDDNNHPNAYCNANTESRGGADCAASSPKSMRTSS